MILIIDHNDSFTYNLYQYFLELQEEVQVVSATSFSLEAFQQIAPEMVVLSPGPGSPEDFPISLALLDKIQVPILGICLGHQMIGHFSGQKWCRQTSQFTEKQVSFRILGKVCLQTLNLLSK